MTEKVLGLKSSLARDIEECYNFKFASFENGLIPVVSFEWLEKELDKIDFVGIVLIDFHGVDIIDFHGVGKTNTEIIKRIIEAAKKWGGDGNE
jgi:hypothetical protein